MRSRTRSSTNQRSTPPGYWTLWSTVALDLVGFGIVVPVLPRFAEEFGASPAVIGVLVACYAAAQAVGAPILGAWSDRVGRKPVLLVSLVGSAVSSVLIGVAPTLALLFVARVLDGASGASISVAHAAVADLAPPDQRARLLGLLGAAIGLGFVAGPALGAIAALVDHRAPFFLAALLELANAAAALRRLPETRVAGEPEPAGGPGPSLGGAASPNGHGGGEIGDAGTPSVGRLLVVAFAAMAAFSGFETTFALLAEHRFELSTSQTYAVFVAVGVTLAIAQARLVGPTVDRLGESGALRAGLALNGAGLAVLAVADTYVLLALALGLLVVGQGAVSPSLSSLVAGRDARRGRVFGRLESSRSAARIAGPLAAGALFGHVGTGAPYAAGAAVVLASLALLPPSKRATAADRAHADAPPAGAEPGATGPAASDRPAVDVPGAGADPGAGAADDAEPGSLEEIDLR